MAKGFYHQPLFTASMFLIFIQRSKMADLVWNLIYIILAFQHRLPPVPAGWLSQAQGKGTVLS